MFAYVGDWYEIVLPLQRIWVLQVQEVRGVLEDLLNPSFLEGQWVLGGLESLLHPEFHIHPIDMKRNVKHL